MRRADAPPPGWYPDPTGGARLWWWDGLDWTDHRRSPPTTGLTGAVDETGPPRTDTATEAGRTPLKSQVRTTAPRARDETAELMAEVRRVARDEVDRGVRRVSDSARDATRRLEPLISQYGDRVLGWIRNLGIVAIALVVLWVVLQAFVQTSVLDWIGERIDTLFGGGATPPLGTLGGPFGRA